ncbi:YtpI family protein [Paenibacillus sp. FA6]|uniref:YtpI family protein n=1 Tax=Paenibacillus sp. FA6 TaxID=3413029 RepID=UPI003F65CEE8
MISLIKVILLVLLIATCIASAYYSLRSHRSSDPIDRGLFGAITNILMGFMLIILAITFMFVFQGSTPSVIVEALFMVLGVFNLFAGIRNRKHYVQQKSKTQAI